MAQIEDATGNPILANVVASGTFTLVNDEALVTIFGQAVAAVQVAGLAGAITISFEESVDGVNYQAISGVRRADGLVAASTTANGVWSFTVGGAKKFRARASAVAGGTATVSVVAGQGAGAPAFGGSVAIVGAVTVAEPVSVDDNGGSLTVDPAGGSMSVDDGGGSLTVDAASLPLPTGAATSALQTQPGVDIGDVTVNNAAGAAAVNIQDGGNSITIDGTVTATAEGQAANDAPVAGNPVRVGAKADTTEPTAVADGDTVDLLADLNGKLVTMPYSVPERSVDGITASMTGTGDTAVIAAPGASLRLYITQILVTNGHATVGTYVNIKSAATSRYTGYARQAGGGFALTFVKPLRLGVNEALNAANVTTGSDTRVSAAGFIAP